MLVIRFEEITEAHIRYIADNMRDEDRAEILALGKNDIYTALMGGMTESDFSVAVVAQDGTPLTVLGVVRRGIITGTGTPWLLSSVDALQHRRQFLLLSKDVVGEMLEFCPRLENYVHSKNKLSIRWLKWIGFKIHFKDPLVIKETDEKFYRFTLEKLDV